LNSLILVYHIINESVKLLVAGREQEHLPSVVKATDSGIEDTASYMEPSAIRLRESDFQQIDDDIDGSLMEGSVVDTDYADCFATKTTANGGAKRTVDDEQTSSQQESRKWETTEQSLTS